MKKETIRTTNYKALAAIFVFVLFAASCGNSDDKQAKLKNLITQRDALNEQIAALEKEMASENGSTSAKKVLTVKANQVNTTVFKHFIEVQGTIESDNNIFIPPKMPGVVQRIYVKEGDQVSNGQLLAELDGTIYQHQIDALATQLELARTAFDRQKRLWEQKIGSEMQYLGAKTQKEALEKQMETVKEQYKLTKIYSPISGTVDEIKIKEGEAAAAGFGAIRVVKLTELSIKATLSEKYINSVSEKDSVSINIPALNREFKQRINAVAKVIDPKNRTFAVEIKIPGKIDNVKPNMLAVLTINDYVNKAAFVVPLNVVQKSGNEQFVYVATKNGDKWNATQKTVKTGLYYEESIEILEGLQTGDHVITFGFQNLADGQEVLLQE